MVINKQDIIIFVSGLIIGFFTSYFIFKKEVEIIKVPVKIEVPVAGVKDSFPYEVPILKPYPVKNPINEELSSELAKAKSELDSLIILKDFVKPKVYRKTFEDKVQKIKVDMIASGSVDNVKVNYDIFPKTITIDTVINVPTPRKAELYIGGEVILPTDFITVKSPSVAPGILLVNKKHSKTFTVGYDFVNKTAKAGMFFRL